MNPQANDWDNDVEMIDYKTNLKMIPTLLLSGHRSAAIAHRHFYHFGVSLFLMQILAKKTLFGVI